METHLALREQIDELATRLVLDTGNEGPSSDASAFAAALTRISEEARGTGCPETAGIASKLAEGIRTGGVEDLQEGFAQLQQMMEKEGRNAASPAAEPAARPPLPANPLAEDRELVSDFIMESREHLASIESQLLTLERDPANTEAIHSVFRGFHTIKGLAGFLEFTAIQEVAHEVETLLDLARNSKLAITPAVVDVVLESADYLKQSLAAVESSQAERKPAPTADNRALLLRVRGVSRGRGSEPARLEPGAALSQLSRSMAGEEGQAAPRPGTTAAAAVSSEPGSEGAPSERRKKDAPGKAADPFSVRVETGKLDYLMDMVGEMVIAQSLIRQNPNLASVHDPRLLGDLSQLAHITSEVQRTTMALRMIPISQLFHRTARVLRDLSRKAGKPVELVTSGEDTELDKTIIEELADPLMHMVRNAVDHGIEPREVREAAGKSPMARVRLAACHQGGQIVVEISDDGRGLDREAILKKARQKGFIEDHAHLSDDEVLNLIFKPGFSTADQVTDVSGRGVGMDVVRKHIQKLRGRVDIQSKTGHGATFFLRLPLTLAIIEGLVVLVGSHRYIIPLFAVREMFRPTPDSLATVQDRDEMALVRGRLLPVVRLYRRFGVQPRSEDPCQGVLVVSECAGRPFCLLVDDLVGKQEVVIKSLGESLKNIAGIAGGAILGDGRVGLILDMDGVFRGGG